jgi:hypothetical protein
MYECLHRLLSCRWEGARVSLAPPRPRTVVHIRADAGVGASVLKSHLSWHLQDEDDLTAPPKGSLVLQVQGCVPRAMFTAHEEPVQSGVAKSVYWANLSLVADPSHSPYRAHVDGHWVDDHGSPAVPHRVLSRNGCRHPLAFRAREERRTRSQDQIMADAVGAGRVLLPGQVSIVAVPCRRSSQRPPDAQQAARTGRVLRRAGRLRAASDARNEDASRG